MWAKDVAELEDVKRSMVALCQAMSDIAETSVELIEATGIAREE